MEDFALNWLSEARLGMARSGRPGVASEGKVLLSHQINPARLGNAGSGLSGMAWQTKARIYFCDQSNVAWHGLAGSGLEGRAGRGATSEGKGVVLLTN